MKMVFGFFPKLSHLNTLIITYIIMSFISRQSVVHVKIEATILCDVLSKSKQNKSLNLELRDQVKKFAEFCKLAGRECLE
jgi:hypothetical protein